MLLLQLSVKHTDLAEIVTGRMLLSFSGGLIWMYDYSFNVGLLFTWNCYYPCELWPRAGELKLIHGVQGSAQYTHRLDQLWSGPGLLSSTGTVCIHSFVECPTAHNKIHILEIVL